MSEPKTSFLKSPTFKGFLPWALLFLALFMVQKTLDYRMVRAGRDLAGLEDNTLYAYSTSPALCVNEAVYAKHETRRLLVTIGSVAGQSIGATEQRQLIDLHAEKLGQAWEIAARKEMAALNFNVIPEGQVLLVNTEFEAENEWHGWAVAVVPDTDILASLSHVLFSRDLGRIGQPAKELGACM